MSVDWKMVINVHLNGAFNVSHAAANYFKEQEVGRLRALHLDLGPRRQFRPGELLGGQAGHRRPVALDRARHGGFNVRSNCISPFAWTRMIGTIPTDTEAQKARLERSKKMTPAKIAPMAVFLLCDAAEGVTSQIFGVRMNEIMLFNANRPVRSVQRRGLDAGDDRRAGDAVDEVVVLQARSFRRHL